MESEEVAGLLAAKDTRLKGFFRTGRAVVFLSGEGALLEEDASDSSMI